MDRQRFLIIDDNYWSIRCQCLLLTVIQSLIIFSDVCTPTCVCFPICFFRPFLYLPLNLQILNLGLAADKEQVACTSQPHALIDFDHVDKWPTGRMHALTGLTVEEFESLVRSLSRHFPLRRKYTPPQLLGCLLMKLRLNVSHEVLAHLCGFTSRARVSESLQLTVKVVLEHFVSKNLGPQRLPPSTVIQLHTTTIAKQLFGDSKPILVLDGTYIGIQKSACFGAPPPPTLLDGTT